MRGDVDAGPELARRVTPGLVLGPFYPVQQPKDADQRLWRGGDFVPAGARLLRFTGRVCTADGGAVVDATVELWHADPAGRYPHPSAPRREEVSRSFVGYGRVRTDDDGRFEFHSLMPGEYGTGEQRRAGHLHLQITGRYDRLLTQVFLPTSGGLEHDRWFQAATRRNRLVAEVVSQGPDALHLTWDAALAMG